MIFAKGLIETLRKREVNWAIQTNEEWFVAWGMRHAACSMGKNPDNKVGMSSFKPHKTQFANMRVQRPNKIANL